MKDWQVSEMRAALVALAVVACCSSTLRAQGSDAFTTSGQVAFEGTTMSYTVRHLPVSSFPMLPAAVAAELNRRGCLIPQTYEAHGPENVIHGSFKRAGEKDWAALCSVHGTVSLLVFFDGTEASPEVLLSAAETARLGPTPASGLLGMLAFDWGIDVATPETVHEAQSQMRRRPARLDHDAIADANVDGPTIYRFYTGNAWKMIETSD